MWSINPTSFSWLLYRMQPDWWASANHESSSWKLSQDSAARLDSFRQITKHMGVRGSECDSPYLIMFELVSGHHRLLIASTSKVCWSEDTSSKEKGLNEPLLPLFYHLGIFQHLFYPIIPLLAFCFYAPRPVLSVRFIGIGRYVVWILAVSRHVVFLENSYYIMLLHPHHFFHPHPPFLIFLFFDPEKTSTESVCQSPANNATVVPPPFFCPSR